MSPFWTENTIKFLTCHADDRENFISNQRRLQLFLLSRSSHTEYAPVTGLMQIGTTDWSVIEMQNVCQRLALRSTVTTLRVIGAKDNLMFESSLNNELYNLFKMSVLFWGMSYFNKNTKLSSAVPSFPFFAFHLIILTFFFKIYDLLCNNHDFTLIF